MKSQYMIIMAVACILAIGIIAGALTLNNSSVERKVDELVVIAGIHGGEPETGFDPIHGWCTLSEPLIQSTLFKINNGVKIANDLATDYQVSEDGKTCTVNIRDDVKFHDGTKLTAKDVVFTYNEAVKFGESVDLSNMNKTTAINDTTIEFVLNERDSTFIYKLAGLGIVPSDSYKNDTYGSNPIGSGPYKFVQWDKGQQVILEVNEEYYGKKPYFKKITNLFLKSDAALAAVKKGEVDFAELPLMHANESVNNMTYEIRDSTSSLGISLPFVPDTGNKTADGNTIGNNVTSNEAIRKALNYGINRQEIIDGPFKGIGNKSFDGISPLLPWNNSEAAIEDGDVEKAKEILAADGWKDTDGDGIVEKDGKKAEFNLVYASDDIQRQAISVQVAEQAKKFGISINVEGKSWNEIESIKCSDAIVWGFGAVDPSGLYRQFNGKFGGQGYDNPSFYDNSVVNQHMADAMNAENPESSYSSWSKISWDRSTGISPKGDAAWLFVLEFKYGVFVDDSLDMGESQTIYQTHGMDIFKNIYDWKRV